MEDLTHKKRLASKIFSELLPLLRKLGIDEKTVVFAWEFLLNPILELLDLSTGLMHFIADNGCG